MTLAPKSNFLTMTDLTLKTEQQGTYSSCAEDDCTTSDCYSVTKSVDHSVITAVSSTGDDHGEDDNFSVATNEDFPCSEQDFLEDLCCDHHIETRLLLFQSSLDLFHDVGDRKPNSEQVEVSRPIKTVAKAETLDKTTKETAKSVLMGCLKVLEQETYSTDTDADTVFTASELSVTSGRGDTVDFLGRTVTTFECYPEDDVQEADDTVRGVDFAEITVRTFACRLGDNPSTSKYTSTIYSRGVQHCIILNPSCKLNALFLLHFLLSGSGPPIAISRKPINTTTVDINTYEKFVGKNRRRGNELLLSPQERSKMLVAAGYGLEEIARSIIETEHHRHDRCESMEKHQRWKKLRSMFSLQPSFSFDRMSGADNVKSCSRTMKKAVHQSSHSNEGLLVSLRKLKQNQSNKLSPTSKGISCRARVA
jgi:hypothetical protein